MQSSLGSGWQQHYEARFPWGPLAVWPPLSCNKSSRRPRRERKQKRRLSRKMERGEHRNKKKRSKGTRWGAGNSCSLQTFLFLNYYLILFFVIFHVGSEAARSLWAAGEAAESSKRRTEEYFFGFGCLYNRHSALLPQGSRTNNSIHFVLHHNKDILHYDCALLHVPILISYIFLSFECFPSTIPSRLRALKVVCPRLPQPSHFHKACLLESTCSDTLELKDMRYLISRGEIHSVVNEQLEVQEWLQLCEEVLQSSVCHWAGYMPLLFVWWSDLACEVLQP